MKHRRAYFVLLVVALAVAAALAIITIRERPAPKSPDELVPIVWKDARETPMHVLHVGVKKIACTECHTGGTDIGAVGTAPPPASCAKCHDAELKGRHHSGERAATTCLTCHVFGAGKPLVRCNDCHTPTSSSSLRGAPPLEHHAGADLPCGACHAVHGAERAVLSDCTACHTQTNATHGTREVHPSPAGALMLDGSWVGGNLEVDASALAMLRDAAPSRSAAVCTACHVPHASKESARATCSACHANAHATGHDACITCHEPHRARKSDTRACESCHGDHRGVASVKGHDRSCTSCHAPHAPREARASCVVTCHADVKTLAASAGSSKASLPAHAVCTSCHDPHRPAVPPGLSCARCHEATRPSHPAAPATTNRERGPCIGCHAPHRVVEQSAAAMCVSCHPNVGSKHAAHAKGVTCTQCHAPHAFKLSGADTPFLKLCASCHARETKEVAVRSGHAACAACHGTPHAPISKPDCARCHAVETQTAPRGHAACASCHDAHSGSLGTHTACTSCHTKHADKERTLHASVPNGCASCHRAHGPSGVAQPPPCASCHTRPNLAGLHRAAGHADCATCHGGHAAPRSDRATCTTSCHVDKRGHQLDAKVCKGCHLFR